MLPSFPNAGRYRGQVQLQQETPTAHRFIGPARSFLFEIILPSGIGRCEDEQRGIRTQMPCAIVAPAFAVRQPAPPEENFMNPARLSPMLALILLLNAVLALAYDGPVDKKTFTMPSYTTVGGKTLKNVRFGFESYGKLNARGDNAIFIAHFFSGNSHAAGKYKPEDKAPGYWDAIIGAGKPLDTDKYFVVSADTLANLGANDPAVVTTGPSSIDPDTGKPYGMRFPIVTMRDFVNTQKALADALGVRKFAAVMGASMGSLQTMEWAAAYPDMVERAIAVIPGGLEADPYLIGRLNLWMAPI